MAQVDISSGNYELPDTIEAIEFYYQQGLTDGLPVVPPTQERVREFLDSAGLEPKQVVGTSPSRNWVITAEKVTINAVMAGCSPEYMPVVVAAVEAMTEPQFNAPGITETCGASAPLILVNGPIRQKLNINSGWNLLGPGWRANATIGRALRLILINVCGQIPGVTDKATFGHPGRYSYCIAENEELSPWEPFHVEKGYPLEASTVTLFAAKAPHEVNIHSANTPEGILDYVGDIMAIHTYNFGEIMVLIGPEHLKSIVAVGWSKMDVKNYLLDRVKERRPQLVPWDNTPLTLGGVTNTGGNVQFSTALGPAEDIMLIVAGGGGGGFSTVIYPWGDGIWVRSVTKLIRER